MPEPRDLYADGWLDGYRHALTELRDIRQLPTSLPRDPRQWPSLLADLLHQRLLLTLHDYSESR